MITSNNWRSLPKHARIKDLLPILGNKYTLRSNEYACDVLKGPAYRYSTAYDFAQDLLQQKGRWVVENEVRFELSQAQYFPVVITSSIERLGKTANIGTKRMGGQTWYMWYEPKEVDELTQECLDRGDDW